MHDEVWFSSETKEDQLQCHHIPHEDRKAVVWLESGPHYLFIADSENELRTDF